MLLVEKFKIFLQYLDQRWNRVMIADPDDPMTRIAIWVRPGCDLDVTRIGKLWNTLRNCVNNAFQVPSNVYSR